MISKRELMQLRSEWQLDVGVIEKDYVLGWVLSAIAAEPALAGSWVFKGGTWCPSRRRAPGPSRCRPSPHRAAF